MAEQIRTPDEVNTQLAAICAQILPPNVRLVYLPVDVPREQDVNPRSMPKKMFSQLVENIADAGILESIPLCAQVGDQVQIISGHHRIRAAREAGLSHVLVLLYTELDPDRVRSKQLAHNTIAGSDDPELVKRVWEQIADVRARFEAYVDPRIFDDLPAPVRFTQADVNVAALAKTVVIAFLSSQHADFERVVEAILPAGEIDTIYLAQRESFEAWKQALRRVRSEVEIVAIPTAVAEMARLALEALDARKQAEEPE